MRGKEGYEKGWDWLLVYVKGNGKGEVRGLLKERDVNDGRMKKWMWEKGYCVLGGKKEMGEGEEGGGREKGEGCG